METVVNPSMKIEKLQGRWLVNGKRLEELNPIELEFLMAFFSHKKLVDKLNSKFRTWIHTEQK